LLAFQDQTQIVGHAGPGVSASNHRKFVRGQASRGRDRHFRFHALSQRAGLALESLRVHFGERLAERNVDATQQSRLVSLFSRFFGFAFARGGDLESRQVGGGQVHRMGIRRRLGLRKSSRGAGGGRRDASRVCARRMCGLVAPTSGQYAAECEEADDRSNSGHEAILCQPSFCDWPAREIARANGR
jgi:hypothetical protein